MTNNLVDKSATYVANTTTTSRPVVVVIVWHESDMIVQQPKFMCVYLCTYVHTDLRDSWYVLNTPCKYEYEAGSSYVQVARSDSLQRLELVFF